MKNCSIKVFVALATAFMGCGATAGENLLGNPGFENGAEGWKRIEPPVWKIVEGEGYDGTKALVWENDDPKCYVYPAGEIKLEPGRIYHFTALVKTDSIKNGKVQVGIEWSNTQGKWSGGSYASPVDDNGMLKDGWVRYEATTVPMPSDVGEAGLLAVMTKGSVGRVRFDDFTFEAREFRVVDHLVSSAYRNCASGGKVRFVAAIHLNTQDRPLSDYAAELVYRDVEGVERTASANRLEAECAEFELDVAGLRMGRQDVRLRVSRKGEAKALGEASLCFARLEKPLCRRVTFDAERKMLVDGKRFFPLGMYTSTMMTKENYDYYSQAPFNFAVQYGRASTVAQLDAYAAIGVFAAVDVRSLIYGYNYSAKSELKTLAESQQALRAKYAEMGTHPALLMWYLNDEAPLSFVPNVTEVHNFLHEIDPDRPTLTCICRPTEADNFLPSFDVAAIDTYPIGHRDTSNPMHVVWERQRQTDEIMRGMRPHWYIPQMFTWEWFTNLEFRKLNGITDQHFPMRVEMLNMTWQGIAAGANGIVMYSFEAMRRNLKDKEKFEKTWAEVVAVAKEVKRFEPILLSDDLPVAEGLPKEIVARAWRHGDSDCYLLVNRFRIAAKGSLKLPCMAQGIETEVGTGVGLSADGRSLVCDFGPLGYAIVTVRGSRVRRE